MIQAQCRCGEVGLEITDDPIVQVYCHCQDCQAAHGAAYALVAVYRAECVQVVRGEPVTIMVRTMPRKRCCTCGTPLFTDAINLGMRSLNAYLLPKGQFAPQFHAYCVDAVLPVGDDLPHYAGLPIAFGGTDERVAW